MVPIKDDYAVDRYHFVRLVAMLASRVHAIDSAVKVLVALRHKYDVIADGDVRFVDVEPANEAAQKLICYWRDLTGEKGANAVDQPQHLLVMCSFAGEPAEADLDAGLAEEVVGARVLVSNSEACKVAGTRVSLPAYGAFALAW